MKQQFTYALDEANIRKQLQELSAGNTEDAWQKFSQYAEAQPRPVVAKKFPAIKLKVDRRILVPAAAAFVIILLAVLLFNVVDFKKSSKSVQKASVSEPFVPMPQLSEAETILPPPERQDPFENQVVQNDKALVSSKPEVVKEKTDQPNPPDPKKGEPESLSNAKTSVRKENTAETQTTQAEVKSKKREPEEQLAPLHLPDIRPTLLTDEQVEDIRPN